MVPNFLRRPHAGSGKNYSVKKKKTLSLKITYFGRSPVDYLCGRLPLSIFIVT